MRNLYSDAFQKYKEKGEMEAKKAAALADIFGPTDAGDYSIVEKQILLASKIAKHTETIRAALQPSDGWMPTISVTFERYEDGYIVLKTEHGHLFKVSVPNPPKEK